MSRNSFLSDLFAGTPVPAALEISQRRVNAVGLSRHGTGRTITGHASEPLRDGIVTPALNAVNIHDPAGLAAAVRAVADRLSPRPRRIALVLPDTVAKVSLVRFEKVPESANDLDQLIRWQVRKAAPFRIEDAQVSWIDSGPAAGGGREYLVVVARRDIIESYERACDAAGLNAGLVDIASLNLVNAVLATSPVTTGDWLLIHTTAGYATLAVVRDGRIIFFRNRQAERDQGADLGDLVHQTAMYHEDRLGGGAFARVVLAGASVLGSEALELTRRQIEERLGVKVDLLDVRAGVSLRDRIAASADLVDSLAPGTGILLRAGTPAKRRAERAAS